MTFLTPMQIATGLVAVAAYVYRNADTPPYEKRLKHQLGKAIDSERIEKITPIFTKIKSERVKERINKDQVVSIWSEGIEKAVQAESRHKIYQLFISTVISYAINGQITGDELGSIASVGLQKAMEMSSQNMSLFLIQLIQECGRERCTFFSNVDGNFIQPGLCLRQFSSEFNGRKLPKSSTEFFYLAGVSKALEMERSDLLTMVAKSALKDSNVSVYFCCKLSFIYCSEIKKAIKTGDTRRLLTLSESIHGDRSLGFIISYKIALYTNCLLAWKRIMAQCIRMQHLFARSILSVTLKGKIR